MKPLSKVKQINKECFTFRSAEVEWLFLVQLNTVYYGENFAKIQNNELHYFQTESMNIAV